MNAVVTFLRTLLVAIAITILPAMAIAQPAGVLKVAPIGELVYPPANAVIDLSVTPTIPLEASVTIANGTILSVLFFACPASGGACNGGGQMIGIVTSPPYSVRWTVPYAASQTNATQSYLLWVQAQSSTGEIRNSATVPITLIVPSQIPIVELEAPFVVGVRPIGFFTPAAPVLYATARYSLGGSPPGTIVRMDFFDGDSLIGSVVGPNSQPSGFAFTWLNPPPGQHVITARATDSVGHVGRSAPATIYILPADVPPQVTLTSPTTGQQFPGGSTIPLTSTVTRGDGPVSRVEYYAGNTLIATSLASPFSAAWVNPPPGRFGVTARAVDDVDYAVASAAAHIEVFDGARYPSVVMTAPAPGSTRPSGTPITLSATALAPDGALGRVEFFTGASLLGNAPSPPYNFTWNNPASGAHSLTAKAYDTTGRASLPSAPVPITVGANTPPTVSLTQPANGATFAAGSAIALTATATDSNGTIAQVEFRDGATILATKTSTPYTFSWTGAAAGSHQLTARATDNAGGVTISAVVSIVVGTNALPQVALTSPANGQTFATTVPIPLAATASDTDGTITRVEFLDGATVVATVTGAPYTTTWSGASVGSHTITARATDNGGATKTSTSAVVQVVNNSPPTVSLTAPTEGQTIGFGAPIILTAAAADADGAVVNVEFFDGPAKLGGDTTAPFGFTWTGAAVGAHTLTARATDNAGAATTSAAVPITVSANALPAVTWQLPLDGAEFGAGGSISLLATASDPDGGIARVEFLANGVLVGTATATPYAVTWASVPAGAYTLIARAVDSVGAVVSTTPISILVRTLAITIDTPTEGASLATDAVLVAGTYVAPPNSGVTINGQLAHTNGTRFFLNNVYLQPGANTLNVAVVSPDESYVTATRTVTSTASAPWIISLSEDHGPAPLNATIKAIGRTGAQVTQVAYSGLGAAQLDMSGVAGGANLGKLTLAGEAFAAPSISITDSSGQTYTQSFGVMAAFAFDKNQIDALLTRQWANFMIALGGGDVNSALQLMSPHVRPTYQQVFEGLKPWIAEIVGTFSPVASTQISDEMAEFAVSRVINGQRTLFLLYFIRDANGVWRLNSL